MVRDTRGWPDGLDDIGAVERLEAILLNGCEGNQDLANGREYKALRRSLLARDDFADVVPRYIRAQRDLAAFWAYIKSRAPSYAERRKHVRETFQPLAERAEGKTTRPLSPAKWTGRRTATEQAKVVVALGYDVLAGIDLLLDEQERGLHNGPPVEPEREEAIQKLRELHYEIGELLSLAEAGKSLDEKLASVRALKDRALKWTASPAGFALGTLPLTGASVAVGVGVAYLINAICPFDGGALGAAAAGVHAAGAAVQATLKRAPTS